MNGARVRRAVAGRLRRNRAGIETDLGDPVRRRLFSPALYGLYAELAPRLQVHAKGVLLDAGCGSMPYRPLVLPQVERYIGFDRERRAGGVEYVGDVEDLRPVPSASVDTILCSEVLEHVAHPHDALAAFRRVLRPGGVLILTVPFMARLHEEPHDFFRYTEHGLRALLADAGLEVEDMAQTGSLLGYLGHQATMLLLLPVWHLPGVRRVGLTVWSWAVTRPCWWLDRRLPGRRLMPLGYVVVCRRPVSPDSPGGR